MTDDLTLIVGDRKLSGWEGIRVSRGIERLPSDFEIEMTERSLNAEEMIVNPGDACQVLLGNDVVITGYVDLVHPSIGPHRHSIRVAGRGKCADLVDCSAEWPGGQISNSSVLAIAQKFAEKYGIAVTVDEAEEGPPIPQFNLNYGESPFSIIEGICRYRALLAYDLPNGNLHLSRVGARKLTSGFREGENVEAASICRRMDLRYSDYVVITQSVDVTGDLGSLGFLPATVTDPTVRHRLRYIVSEVPFSDLAVAKQRAIWEYKRRLGRSSAVHLVTDSWRDSSGALWEPNALVDLDIPTLRISDTWLISEVNYLLDESGTRAELTIMPPDAFLVSLPPLQPFADVVQAIAHPR